MLPRVLQWKGFHFLLTRFGSAGLKQLAFDEKFNSGDWDYADNGPEEMIRLTTRFSRNGHILLLGCGNAALLKHLPRNVFNSLLGIDLSPRAIQIAEQHKGPNISFQQGDMACISYSQSYDLIIFSESIYYISYFKRKNYLHKICKYLSPNGSIVVTIADANRYKSVFDLIRAQFKVLEDKMFAGSLRRYIVFGPR